ncbi:MAG: hypothetical protein JWQ18_2241, partial [Conexibacter sp.]|nr:hypothetical protein [Conexibacter sp.]
MSERDRELPALERLGEEIER